jgi:hypothetical protein
LPSQYIWRARLLRHLDDDDGVVGFDNGARTKKVGLHCLLYSALMFVAEERDIDRIQKRFPNLLISRYVASVAI